MKTCTGCRVAKPHSTYARNACTPDGLQYRCKECRNAEKREQRSRPEQRAKINQANREGVYRRKYGLEVGQYDEMFKAQGGVCYICKQPEREGRALSVDHDHVTGEVRKLLCNDCNVGIGRFKESVSLIVSAAMYMMEHDTSPAFVGKEK